MTDTGIYLQLAPKLVDRLLSFGNGLKDVQNYFNSQQGKALAHRISYMMSRAGSKLKDKDLDKLILATAQNSYFNYRTEQNKKRKTKGE